MSGKSVSCGTPDWAEGGIEVEVYSDNEIYLYACDSRESVSLWMTPAVARDLAKILLDAADDAEE